MMAPVSCPDMPAVLSVDTNNPHIIRDAGFELSIDNKPGDPFLWYATATATHNIHTKRNVG